MDIQGCVTIVTGASSGIGLATARSFAKAGAKVVLAARSKDKLETFVEELQEQGCDVLAVATDMTDQMQVAHMLETAYDHYRRLDILINNAARASASYVASAPIDHFRQTFELNVIGSLYAIQAAIPKMRQHGGGLIINISSGSGRYAVPGFAAYGASKAALDIISNTMREELMTENIRIVTVYPPPTVSNAVEHMMGDLEVLRESQNKVRNGGNIAMATAESVADKIVEAAKSEPHNLYLDQDTLKKA